MTATLSPSQSLAARRHLAYRYLLKKCLRLEPHHMKALMREWNMTRSQVRRAGFRSAPQDKYQTMLVNSAMRQYIDLQGIAGFYVELDLESGQCHWKLNAPSASSILRPFRDSNELIQGVLIYRNKFINRKFIPAAADTDPILLSSSRLMLGAKAVNFNASLHH